MGHTQLLLWKSLFLAAQGLQSVELVKLVDLLMRVIITQDQQNYSVKGILSDSILNV